MKAALKSPLIVCSEIRSIVLLLTMIDSNKVLILYSNAEPENRLDGLAYGEPSLLLP